MVRRRVLALVAVATLLLLCAAAAAIWFQVNVFSPYQHQAADRLVTIESGMGTRAIVARLGASGVIRSESAVLLWLTATGQGKQLKAGEYQFDSPMSAYDVIEKIRRGEVATRRVTIVEGKTRFWIAETLAKTNVGTEAEFLRLTADPTLVRDLDPKAETLEGYLYPDTYEYTGQTTPAELVKLMVDRFRTVFKPEWTQRAAERNLTMHDVVTLASMVEAEARLDEERPVIASVFNNRIAKGMGFESDPTFIYAALLVGDYDGDVNNPKHRRRMSRYNTYQFEGLPPGPISSPRARSLEAVVEPAQTNYIYFVVSGTDGHHKFSATAEEHEAAVAAYRRQQAEERKNAAPDGQ